MWPPETYGVDDEIEERLDEETETDDPDEHAGELGWWSVSGIYVKEAWGQKEFDLSYLE